MDCIELFSGIGGFRFAADSQSHRTVWANDICAKACIVYRDRFGKEGLTEGDVRTFLNEIPPHELLTGGFPCQPFSSAGKKEGIRDPRGTLFQVIVDVLKKHQPNYFILENVKRLITMEQGFHFATILASLSELDYHVEWRLLNAMDLGLPQNRQRVFLLGTHKRVSKVDAPLRSKLASAADLKELSSSSIERFSNQESWKPIERHGSRFPTWGIAHEGRFFGADLPSFSEGKPRVALSTILQKKVSEDFDFTETTLTWLSSNSPVNRLVQGVEILSNQLGGARMGYTIFGINGVAPTLTSTTSRHYERYKIGDRYRRLTNIEYARIQGFPDEHCGAVSVYDQYQLFGNAVPPPMATWVMKRIKLKGVGAEDIQGKQRIRGLFDDSYERTASREIAAKTG